MKVCVDVGNSAIKIGFYETTKLVKKVILNTENKPSSEFENSLYFILKKDNFVVPTVTGIIYSSVVPCVDDSLKTAICNVCKCSVIVVLNAKTKFNLKLNVKKPDEVGSDLIADLVGVKNKFHGPCLVIDFGTATKILYLDASDTFQTCAFMPGLSTCARALSSKAALLPDVDYSKLTNIIEAKETDQAMANGLIYGHIDAVVGIVNRMEDELNIPLRKVFTGGIAKHLKDLLPSEFEYEENLNLDGLISILNENER